MPVLIPLPSAVEWGVGEYLLTERTTIGCRAGASPQEAEAASAVRLVLAETTGLPLPAADDPGILVSLDPGLPAEGYRLEVRPDGVSITAADRRGALWAAQTLLQLGPDDVYAVPLGKSVPLAAARIEDAPRFARRGAMLDSSRHFLQVAEVLDFIDWMARHKLNVFHWHLTDDQGWRVASDRYPLLAEKASWRSKTSNRVWGDDGTPHGGYYTLQQIAAVAEYARQRGIETVPEIDFPGHATAVLAAYPQFATDPSGLDGVAHYPTIFDNVLNFSPESLEFVHEIWSEVIEATGARYVHIGGDEVPTVHWEASEEVAQRAKGVRRRRSGLDPALVYAAHAGLAERARRDPDRLGRGRRPRSGRRHGLPVLARRGAGGEGGDAGHGRDHEPLQPHLLRLLPVRCAGGTLRAG